MKLSVKLNQKSIQSAIETLKSYNLIYNDFLEDVCSWIINIANQNLNNSSIGESIKAEIRSKWHYEITKKGAKIWNDSDNAVFVEFGVGKTGQNSPHPVSGDAVYKYNIPTIHKYATEKHPDENTWRYVTSNLSSVDLQEGNYEAYEMRDGKLKIITTGSPAVMYAYNAIVAAQNDALNPNGEIAKLWENNVKRYWK